MFRERQPLAWLFHRNTCRGPHNMASAAVPSPVPGLKEYPNVPLIPLGEPQWPDTSLTQALAARLSCRRFTGEPLTLSALGTVLHAAYGVRGAFTFEDLEYLERPVPSGGGLYPLELYTLVRDVNGLAPGIYHYAALSHALEKLSEGALPPGLCSQLFMHQPYLEKASAILVLTAMPERSLWKYTDRGYRYILLEAGHVAQNVNLTAAAGGLGSFNLGGFFDQDLAALLGLDMEQEWPVYGIALGVPAPLERNALRSPSNP